ncbi:MAG: hypothetical protein L0Y64_18355 [Myxococcaceae bacterium]|nr:hypothetical protein [Myxococcaceae bacterium]
MREHAASHPLVLIEADAGYGKTTFAGELAAQRLTVWYSLSASDRDPSMFLAHLLYALDAVCPGIADSLAHAVTGPASHDWPELIDHITGELDARLAADTYVILDDFHSVEGSGIGAIVERFVDRLPRRVHLLVTARTHVLSQAVIRWKAAGDLFLVGRADLAFTPDEVLAFYAHRFGVTLTPEQAALMSGETEGWPIAMQLFGQHLRDSGERLEALVGRLPKGRQEIFAYLSDQVLAVQSAEVRELLLQTACLQQVDAPVCAALLELPDATATLEQVVESGLFCVTAAGGVHRYHHLFRDFLRSQLPPETLRANHRRAAAHYRAHGQLDDAVHHALAGGDLEAAATDLELLGDALIASGRYLTLLGWSDQLPAGLRASRARLLLQRSQALRFLSRFRDAADDLRAAGAVYLAREDVPGAFDADEAEARIYLDTVQAARAYAVLVRMGWRRRGLDAGRRWRWRMMVAETRVNQGRLDAALKAYQRLGKVPGDRELVRLLVRRGELHKAVSQLERSGTDLDERVPHSHRERDALLAWVYGLLGDASRAEMHARTGMARGEQLRSPIVTCVCTSRLGHALLGARPDDPERALAVYGEALRIAEQIEVPRFAAEALIGLTVASARNGDAVATWRHGQRALEVLEVVGDRYVAAIARLALGIGAAELGHPDAEKWLEDAGREAQRCGDRYMPLLSQVWRAQLALTRGDEAAFAPLATAALQAMRNDGLETVLARSPWLGLRSAEARVAWLRSAARLPSVGSYAGYLLRQLQPAGDGTVTSGSAEGGERMNNPLTLSLSQRERGVARGDVPALAVRLLGTFEVLRDGAPIDARRWARRKARDLFWLLCTRPRRSLQREEAVEALWPGDDLEPSTVRFRVALHALNDVLEPERTPRTPTRFVHSAGDQVTLDAGVWLDVDEFLRHARLSRREASPARALELAQHALELHRGPLLAEAPFLDGIESLREAVRTAFVDVALAVGEGALSRGDFDQARELALRVRGEDPFQELAYRLLARVSLATGDVAGAQRVADECRSRLVAELGVQPSWRLADLTALRHA